MYPFDKIHRQCEVKHTLLLYDLYHKERVGKRCSLTFTRNGSRSRQRFFEEKRERGSSSLNADMNEHGGYHSSSWHNDHKKEKVDEFFSKKSKLDSLLRNQTNSHSKKQSHFFEVILIKSSLLKEIRAWRSKGKLQTTSHTYHTSNRETVIFEITLTMKIPASLSIIYGHFSEGKTDNTMRLFE
jgi:hypothetical protein